MKTFSADELRSLYFQFFVDRGHALIPSASLIPENDPSVLFTTAGMHPLVPYLMGQPHPAGARLVNCQKCVRTTDVDEVGDATHLTFFEMLGNWSLGDYFKQESIAWSFEFLTDARYLGIPLDDLWFTVFEGNDDTPRDEEAAEIWRSLGVPDDRVVYLSAEHNWWAVGEEGPCGPDTEIFVDLTHEPCPAGGDCLPGACDCGRFVEVWNNVFMTFERRDGRLHPLPKRNVDTGMGLERTLAILQGATDVYETAPLSDIVGAIIDASRRDAESVKQSPEATRAVRVLADHLRAAVFMLGDPVPVVPGAQGPGYVLRRLIRRGMRFCNVVGLDHKAWTDLGQLVIDKYQDAYPELGERAEAITGELASERERFSKTLQRGTDRLEREIKQLLDQGADAFPSDVAFQLYETYGFPVEFTAELVGEHGLSVDLDAVKQHLEDHRQKSRSEAAKSGLADDSEESVRYHTATHLLHSALRQVLGDHVLQRGSNITRDRLRFDFSHPQAMTKDEVREVEALVQKQIDRQLEVTRAVVPLPEAREMGAIGLFDDKYEGEVSVYRVGDFSLEFCGGPHVTNTGELGTFKVVKEQSSGAGVRRIRAQLS